MSDRRIFLAVIIFLGLTLVLSITAIAALAGTEKPIPSILENVVVGCLTGLAGLLAKGPTSDERQEVVVRQPPNDPIPVEDTGAGEVRFILLSLAGSLLALLLWVWFVRELVHL